MCLLVSMFISIVEDDIDIESHSSYSNHAKPVTESEVNNFLQSTLNIQIAPLTKRDIYHSSYLFLYDNDSGKIYITTSKISRKTQNIQRNLDRVYFRLMMRIFHTRSKEGSCKNIRDMQKNLSL